MCAIGEIDVAAGFVDDDEEAASVLALAGSDFDELATGEAG